MLHEISAGVIRGKSESPVPKLLKKVTQVTSGGASGPLNIEPLIVFRCDAQAITARSVGHELPDTAGALGGKSICLTTALDQHNGRKLGWNAFLTQNRLDDG